MKDLGNMAIRKLKRLNKYLRLTLVYTNFEKMFSIGMITIFI